LRSASSRPLWLLLSLAVAFGVLAWSAQREQASPSRIVGRVDVVPDVGSWMFAYSYSYSPVGTGFFFPRLQGVTMMSGIDVITVQVRKLP
jgi:hypothetical protein